jgi:hypothetical protein
MMPPRYQPSRLTSYDKESILTEIRRVVLAHFGGRRPRRDQFDKHSRVKSWAVRKHFGSWSAALQAAGLPDTPPTSSILEPISTALPKSARTGGRRSEYSEDDLYVELARVIRSLGRRPSYSEFQRLSSIGIRAYERRFGSWRAAIDWFAGKSGEQMRRPSGSWATPHTLLSELASVAESTSKRRITYREYRTLGGSYSIGAFQSHFGSWKDALAAIDYRDGHSSSHSDEDMFGEIQRLWELYGRQPTFREMETDGRLAGKVFQMRFGTWMKAIHAFCEDREKDESASGGRPQEVSVFRPPAALTTQLSRGPDPREPATPRRPSRAPSLRLRFTVLKRDSFRCLACGKSPATHPGVHLEIDHVVPYSRGGSTDLANLQSLCRDCNRGKSSI